MDKIISLIKELNEIEDKNRSVSFGRYYHLVLYMDLCGCLEIEDDIIFSFDDLSQLEEELHKFIEELKKE